MDQKSLWQVSGLFSTALESMTLPSRLRALNGQRQTLDEIAGALNVNGNQKIAKLQMSIGPNSEPRQANGDHRPGRLEVQARAQSRDSRMPSQDRRAAVLDTDDENTIALDIDFFPSEEIDRSRVRRPAKAAHLFGQAENLRGDEGNLANSPDKDDFDGQERARRRAAGLPILHKSVEHLSYSPILVHPLIINMSPITYDDVASSTFAFVAPFVLDGKFSKLNVHLFICSA